MSLSPAFPDCYPDTPTFLLPASVNGQTLPKEFFDLVLREVDREGIAKYEVVPWVELMKTKERPHGLPSTAKPMYFTYKYFLENNTLNWANMIYVAKEEHFYILNRGVWVKMVKGIIKSNICLLVKQYFGITDPTLESLCYSQLKTFFTIEEIKQDRTYIAFADCCVDREKLVKKELVVKPIHPSYMIVEFLPHNVMEFFAKIEVKPELFTMEGALAALGRFTLTEMALRFLPSKLVDMYYGLIADLIDTDIPQQWIFLLQSQMGGTGKGTLTKIAREIIGIDNIISINQSMLKGQFLNSFLLHSKMYTIPETTKAAFKGDALPLIKAYSGGDAATADFKHVTIPTTFIPRGVWVINTNDTPDLPVSEMAIFRRFVILPMPKVRPIGSKKYEQYMRVVREEYAELAAYVTFLIPFKKDLHDRYQAENNVEDIYETIGNVPQWEFFEEFIQTNQNDVEIHTEEIHQAFKEYLQSIERNDYHTDFKSFKKMLHSHFRNANIIPIKRASMVNKNRGYYYKGINLNPKMMYDMKRVLKDQEDQYDIEHPFIDA